MANEEIIFKKGLSSSIPSTKIAGQVLFETDTGNMYIDTSSSIRMQVKDNTKVENIQLSDPYFNNESININVIKNGATSSSMKLHANNGLYFDKTTSQQTGQDPIVVHELQMIPPIILVGNMQEQTMTYINSDNEEIEYNKITFERYNNSSSTSTIAITDKYLREDRLYVDIEQGGTGKAYRWITFTDKNSIRHSTFVPVHSDLYDDFIETFGHYPINIDDNSSNSTSNTWSAYKINSIVSDISSTYVKKIGDTITGPLYADVTSNNMPSLDSTNAPDVRGLYGVKFNSTLTPFLHVANKNNVAGGVGVALTAGGLTLVGSGENALKILNNAANGNGSIDSSGSTIISPVKEELILASDNGISFFTNGETTAPQSFIDNSGIFNGSVKKNLSVSLYGNAAQGNAIIQNTAAAASYKPILYTKATGVVNTNEDGAFVLAAKGDSFILHYNDSDKIGNFGSTTKQAILLDVNGNASFPGTVTIQTPTASNHATNKQYVDGLVNKIATINANSISSTESENWRIVAQGDVLGNNDNNMLFYVTDSYNHGSGFLKLHIRVSGSNNSFDAVTDTSNSQGPRLIWLSRNKDINPNQYRLRIKSKSDHSGSIWVLEALLHRQYYTMSFELLKVTGNNGINNIQAYTLYTNSPAINTENTVAVITSTDVIPLGGNWSGNTGNGATSYKTNNAEGITIGQYGACTTATVGNIAIGGYGNKTTSATGSWAVAFGSGANATGANSIANGIDTTASGNYSTAIGIGSSVTSTGGVVVGYNNSTSSGVALGQENTAGAYATASGYNNTASGADSVAIGRNCTATAFGAIALGYKNDQTAQMGCTIGGISESTKEGSCSIGAGHTNNSAGCTIVGRCGTTKTNNTSFTSYSGDVFIVGRGTITPSNNSYTKTQENALRLGYDGNMKLVSGGSYNTSGADYAEFVKEWYDGNPNNEDRVGYMVTIGEDKKLHKANENDYIIGVTSGAPAVIGNADEDYFWKYETDNFNRIIYENVTIEEIKMNPITGENILDENGQPIKEVRVELHPKLNPNYDSSLTYIERSKRPEWDYVGMRGIIPCRDDGTCVAGGFCKCGNNGIATYSSQQGFNTYYVIERISENIVSIEVK